MNQSYWQKTTHKEAEKTIDNDISTDIVIIGGGLSGVALAYQLKDSPFQVIVIEKDELGSHTSGHTTAKITTLHSTLYQKITKHYDIHQAYLYYKSNYQALNEVKEIIKKEKIDCDYKENNAYIYTDDPTYTSIIRKEKEILESLRVETIQDDQHLESLGLKNQAIFHPLKYLYALVEICKKSGVHFYEHSQVINIERKDDSFIIDVNGCKVQSRYLIHATRYPFIKKKLYFLKLFQEKEYVDCREEYKDNCSYLCIDQTKSRRPLEAKKSIIIDRDSKQWFAQDSIPLRGIPYIGRLQRYSNEFIIYGFQKWGMTLSQVAARLISDIILEKDNPYEDLYACYYFSMSFMKEHQSQVYKNTKKGMITNRLRNEPLQILENNDGMVTKVNHKLMAVYKDNQGELHYLSPYCPHLKCIVEFHKKDQTWTCPCHQSVYDAYGKLIEGPSLKCLKEIDIENK
ncbi:MAG: FAD-dependent oxidoreductase [Coprobacillus sp.]